MLGLGLGLGFGGGRATGYMNNLWHGVRINTTASTYDAERIGSTSMHKYLPWHNKWRRCLLLDNGTVNYYLDPNNSLLKENGSPAVLDGTDGQWMVEIPKHYEKFWTEDNYFYATISEYALPGYTYIPTLYVSAGEATVERGVNKLSSVINTTTTYRGGDNSATNDANDKTLLGKPATVISRTNFREYARNRNAGDTRWNCYTYDAHRVMFWAYIIEYANTHCQLAFNPLLSADGYKQGGLGKGVTDLNGTFWSTWNGYMPFVNIGSTVSLGNNTGIISYQMPASYQVVAGSPATPISVEIPSYRGIENPFGHIWKNADGINVKIQSVADGNQSILYTCYNPAYFNDVDYTNYIQGGNISRTEGYMKTILDGNNGDFLPATVGAGSTTYYCDYFYTSIPASGTALRTCFLGGLATYGASAGLGCSNTSNAPSTASAHVGSRLVFVTEPR